MKLYRAFRVAPNQSLAFVGSGGKTTAIFQLAGELPPPVIVTATTHLGNWQKSFADKHIIVESNFEFNPLPDQLGRITLFTGLEDGNRFKPIGIKALDELHKFCKKNHITLLIEADGSRQKPLKGWADHEPPIPEFVDHVVHVAGLASLGKPLTQDTVHRPEIFSVLSDIQPSQAITSDAILRSSLNVHGARKNFPSKVRRTILLNQADTHETQATARSLAGKLLDGFDAVTISSLRQEKVFASHERIAGIVLAAGESSRLGRPKQLLDWHGEPFVRVVIKKAIEAGLFPIHLIVGANADEVVHVVDDLNVRVVLNPDWKQGQASSIRSGISTILHNHDTLVGGVIFLLVDQPQVSVSVLQTLKEKHAEGLYPVIAPFVMDRRANPVLFDRDTFSDLMKLEGDVGGRGIFHKHSVEYLPWHDDGLLLDVDTPEQYERLLSDKSL